jgi:hypothetical protein
MTNVESNWLANRIASSANSLDQWNNKMAKAEEDIKEEELWSLDTTLTDYILPRIIAFRKMERNGYPIGRPLGVEDKVSDEEWRAIEKRSMLQWENDLRSIELAFSLMSKSQHFERSDQANKDIKIGLELFAKHYEHLWD